jgi:hypothetical protein
MGGSKSDDCLRHRLLYARLRGEGVQGKRSRGTGLKGAGGDRTTATRIARTDSRDALSLLADEDERRDRTAGLIVMRFTSFPVVTPALPRGPGGGGKKENHDHSGLFKCRYARARPIEKNGLIGGTPGTSAGLAGVSQPI